MKILIAHADRDLLACYKTLIENDGHDVTTAFDGPQVITDIYKSEYDCVVLDDNIPRTPCQKLISLLNENKIPVLILSQKKITYNILLDNDPASSYLSFPFLPDELKTRLKNVVNMMNSKDNLAFNDAVIEPGKLMLNGKYRVTFDEAKVFSDIINGVELESENLTVYVNALNKKFALCGLNVRIKYVLNKGYRMVTVNE